MLIADLSGYTSLAELLYREQGPRGVNELFSRVNEYFDILVNTVDHFGGDIIKFAGDAVICYVSQHSFGFFHRDPTHQDTNTNTFQRSGVSRVVMTG